MAQWIIWIAQLIRAPARKAGDSGSNPGPGENFSLKLIEWLLFVCWRLTHAYRDICANLHLERIQWAAKLVPNDKLLRFHKNADIDGFVADLTANTAVTQEMYQLKVSTMPGGGLYEVSMKYDIPEGTFSVKVITTLYNLQYSSHARDVPGGGLYEGLQLPHRSTRLLQLTGRWQYDGIMSLAYF